MLANQLAALTEPPGVAEALTVIDGFDDVIVAGLGRVNDATSTGLAGLAAAVADSPLGGPVRATVEKVVRGGVDDDQVALLAGARTAVFGAVHDALLTSLDAALGRTRSEPAPAVVQEPGQDPAVEGARSWLRDVAIAGWRGVDEDLITAAGQPIESLYPVVARRRLAMVLAGLSEELGACVPIANLPQLPARRWTDLWTRAVLLSRMSTVDASAAPVTNGRLLPLGVDMHEHGTAVQLQLHGVLEDKGQTRLVRASVSAGKVETIAGPGVWPLLHRHPVLLRALAERRCLHLTDMPLLPEGDLLWADDRAAAGDPVDEFATARLALPTTVAPAVAPLNRHPATIGEVVLVEGYRCDGGALVLGGERLGLALDRLPAAGPLSPAHVAASSACLGLLRWNGGAWRLQPMAVQTTVKKKNVTVRTADWAMGPTDPKVAKATGDAVSVLSERAGRLLRR